MPSNRLSEATSPYLRQHAYNPVDWWPWCPEALELARQQDRPILLSIGYSACHWCHVMAHESFADPATAALMNRLFVNIKVDREERPDLDRIYQSAHQVLAQRPGGWPLTLFLTPEDQVPFFAGTYFPNAPRHGLPPFKQVLLRVEAIYREHPGPIREQNQAMLETLASFTPRIAQIAEQPHAGPLELARRQLALHFDRDYGGFGGAPKFPHSTHMEFLLRYWAVTKDQGRPDSEALHMVTLTLESMIQGGIHDHLGGGFCRYAVDAQWMIPHFEKMLYDNGPLLALCCDAWQATGKALFRDAASTLGDWVMREMQAPEGGYYSSLDADSEGQEGRFYVWDREQVRGLLDPEEYALFAPAYDLDQAPNFEDAWHLRLACTPERLAAEQGLPIASVVARLASARQKLFAARAGRVRPGRDEKCLTAWNALMIKGMARAARVLARPDYLASAEAALGFIRGQLWRDGRLLATWKNGHAQLMAYLDDYAYLLDALLELLQTRWRRADLELAKALADALLTYFSAPQGGFYFTAHDHESLIHRPLPLADDAIPAGNGIAALALLRLGHLLGDSRYLDAVEGILCLAWPQLRQTPYAHGSLLMALDEWLQPGTTLVIRAAAEDLEHWRTHCPPGFAPRRYALLIPATETDLPGLLGERISRPGGIAYLCQGIQCAPPIASPEHLREALTTLPGV